MIALHTISDTSAGHLRLKPLISIYNVNHQQTNYCVNNAGLDGHMRSPPEKLHLALGVVPFSTFLVTSDISPELLTCANGLRF